MTIMTTTVYLACTVNKTMNYVGEADYKHASMLMIVITAYE